MPRVKHLVQRNRALAAKTREQLRQEEEAARVKQPEIIAPIETEDMQRAQDEEAEAVPTETQAETEGAAEGRAPEEDDRAGRKCNRSKSRKKQEVQIRDEEAPAARTRNQAKIRQQAEINTHNAQMRKRVQTRQETKGKGIEEHEQPVRRRQTRSKSNYRASGSEVQIQTEVISLSTTQDDPQESVQMQETVTQPLEDGSLISSSSSESSYEKIDDTLRCFLKTRKQTLQYDPTDRRSINRYKVVRRETKNPRDFTCSSEPLSLRFFDKKAEEQYNIIRHKSILPERYISMKSCLQEGMDTLISRNGLYETVANRESFVREVVLEFYSNFQSAAHESRTDVVYLRGKLYDFSPSMINNTFKISQSPFHEESETFLDVSAHNVIKCLTGNRLQKWQLFSTSLLTPTMVHVYGICCFNWIPTLHTTTVTKERAKFLYKLAKGMQFNFGKMVHDQISHIAKNLHDIKIKTLFFPSLIYQVLQFQREVPLMPGEVYEAQIKQLKADSRSGRGRINTPVPTFVLGRSIGADLDHVRGLLNVIEDHAKRGDYGPLFQNEGFEAQGSVLGANTLAETEASENEESCSSSF